MLACEVAYAPSPDEQEIVSLQIKVGTSVLDAIHQAGFADKVQKAVGIFGRQVDPDKTVVEAGDRIEIYRPLIHDPKKARLTRVARRPSQ